MAPMSIGDGRLLMALTTREWLMTDGRGGYSLGTHAGLNTRKYHGLLVVSRPPPVGRLMLVSRVEDTFVADDGVRIPLDTGCYEPGILHPEGYRSLVDFHANPLPQWTYRAADREIRKTLAFDPTAERLTVRWELVSGEPGAIEVRPLLTRRSHHAVARAGDFDSQVDVEPGLVRWRPHAGEPATVIRFDGAVIDPTPYVYGDVLYSLEKERGYDAVEDLHAPALIRLALTPALAAELQISAEDAPAPRARLPAPRAGRPMPKVGLLAEARSALVAAADHFLINGPDGMPGIVAGYPWFEEWGRDTMLAIPGLCLATGRAAHACAMLEAWSRRLGQGLLPNRVGDHHSVDTNAADAPLLFIRAIELVDVALRDRRRIEQRFFAAVNSILDWYHRGTKHGIGVGADGLLRAGEPGVALTWMDAVVNGEPVTPRRGKPVELNALYAEALRFGAELADRRADDELGVVYRERAMRLEMAMRDRFIDQKSGTIRDVVDLSGPGDAEAFRPNLLFALASKSTPFTTEQAERNLARVELELLTPYGLRTLSPHHAAYSPRYFGDQGARDRAYHQGTVWPWMMGLYADALIQTRGDNARTRQKIEAALVPLLKFVVEHGILPEVFDGDAPHAPGGCPAQAWSVAEVLRVVDWLMR